MRERVERLLGHGTRSMWLSTFHSACARILRSEADRLGYTRTFTIYDQADSRRLAKRSAEAVGVDMTRYKPAALQGRISDAKNRLLDVDAYREQAQDPFDEQMAEVYASYQRQIHAMNAMDFDDLLLRTVELLERYDEVRARYAAAFRYILVDEYQDTNRAQYRLLQLLVGDGSEGPRNITVVGDDAQSIYGFRGADVRNILDFERDFPEAHVVKLEQNYRSTETILGVANAVIAQQPQARSPRSCGANWARASSVQLRELDDEHAEARLIVGEVAPAARRGRGGRRHLRPLPHERHVARDRGPAGPRRHRLPGDRRHEVLRARRDQGRDRLPHVPCQRRRRRGLLAHHQLAAARHRPDLAGADHGASPDAGRNRVGCRRRR